MVSFDSCQRQCSQNLFKNFKEPSPVNWFLRRNFDFRKVKSCTSCELNHEYVNTCCNSKTSFFVFSFIRLWSDSTTFGQRKYWHNSWFICKKFLFTSWISRKANRAIKRFASIQTWHVQCCESRITFLWNRTCSQKSPQDQINSRQDQNPAWFKRRQHFQNFVDS